MIHADDEMGRTANRAALLLTGLDLLLLAASSKTLSREKRAENLLKALTRWRSVCRAMSDLQEAAPVISRQAQDAADRLQDVMEKTDG